MKILATGAAGFIGFHTAKRLLDRGDEVIGIDSLNAYYSPALKQERLAQLTPFPRFSFAQADVAAEDFAGKILSTAPDIDLIVHLAAQAGVRYSVENPRAYVEANVTGQVSIFELAAALPARPPVVYASSSSVYGAQLTVPYAESARADQPVSVYAATKRAGELLAHAYGELHGIATTGLRFFTVYGRYGRPDMAPWLFTDAILAGRPIQVFDSGAMERDFTHVDDIVVGVVAAIDRLAERPTETEPVYNLGNNRPVKLLDFIAAIEEAAGRKAIMEMMPRPKGDVPRTFADITLAQRDLGFAPTTLLADGMADFVGWYSAWRRKNA